MITFLKKVEEKIINELKPQSITVIDNSKLHRKHKSFSPEKYHLKIIIKSDSLKTMSKIDAHKLIFSILKEEMKTNIHALEIDIN